LLAKMAAVRENGSQSAANQRQNGGESAADRRPFYSLIGAKIVGKNGGRERKRRPIGGKSAAKRR
jgi:hypothetical protein